jgi:acyl-CoA synthetase (AMP-forming)/AMP-acid ligase II
VATPREKLAEKAFSLRTLVSAGVYRPERPDRAARALAALYRWGPTAAAAYAVPAARYPAAAAIIDDRGSLTFGDVHRRTNAIANAWADAGVAAGDIVAVLCRNHSGLVEATVAGSKLGAHVLFLNTSFAAPEIAAVCAREQPRAIVYDEEFAQIATQAAPASLRYVGWSDGAAGGAERLEDLAEGDPAEREPPAERGRVVILTSGTTGAPRGAVRRGPASLDPAAALLAVIPLHARGRTLIAAPLFHSWGFAHLLLAGALSSTLVLHRRFEPEETLASIDAHGVTALVVVPVMLQRLLELGERAIGRHDLAALRVIATSGAALPGALAHDVMDAFGDVLYNLYGSTEVAWATIATPADLRAAPGTAGRPPRGTVVRVLGPDDREVAPGETGRIFVGNELVFDGYTGGGGKPSVDGLLGSGDLGHFDAEGRLFVDGRDDEMIVSGGENVFPREVEDVVARLDGVEEVAAIGVVDERFGQRLKAFVVRSPGAELSEQDIREHVRSQLARFKVPREVAFVDELPRNAVGKVLKRELAGYEAEAPDRLT